MQEATLAELNPSTTTAIISQQQIPQWFQSQLESLFARAGSATDAPYTTYGGPRIASFTPDQLAAFNSVRGQQGDWQQQFDPATQYAMQSGLSDVYGTSSPYYMGAAGISGQNTTEPYLTPGLSAVGNAQQTFPQNVDQYMSPYTSNVLDVLAQRAGRNLEENLLPSVNDQFIAAGQYGSGRNEEFVNRALRDSQEALLSEQAGALERGYSTAGNLFNQDASRQLGAANAYQGFGGLGLAESGQDINSLLSVGQGLGTAHGQDVGNQRATSDLLGKLAGQGQQYGLTDSAALGSIGQQQQQLGQSSLNTAYSDFLEQRDYPKTQASFLSSILRGINPPVSSSSTSTGTAATSQLQPSTLSQIAGLGLGGVGLAGAFGKKFAKGGRVRNMADGGQPQPMSMRPQQLARMRPQQRGIGGMPQRPPMGMIPQRGGGQPQMMQRPPMRMPQGIGAMPMGTAQMARGGSVKRKGLGRVAERFQMPRGQMPTIGWAGA